MALYEFVLTFRLASADANPDVFLDALFEAGCDDATVGTGRPGMIGIQFAREASSAEEAMTTAINGVQRAIPGAVLVEAGPDLVNLTDVAQLVGCTKQNIRKYASGEARRTGEVPFPFPAVTSATNLWHFAEVAVWLRRYAAMQVPESVAEVAKAAAKVNLERHQERVRELVEA
jgi:hypothetical protein